MKNSFETLSTLDVAGQKYQIFRLDALNKNGFNIARLPYCLRILLENLLRNEDDVTVTREDIEALASWNPLQPVELVIDHSIQDDAFG